MRNFILNRIVHWYFGKDALPYWCVLGLDFMGLIAFYYVGYFCVLGSKGVVDYFWLKLMLLCFCTIPYMLFYKIFHTYNNVVRYSSYVDLRNILIANALGSLVVLLFRVLFFDYNDLIFPGLRITMFAFALVSMYMCGWRILVNALFEISNVQRDSRSVLIYGTREGAVALAKSIRSQNPSEYRVVGFVSPACDARNHIAGLPVYADDVSLVAKMIQMRIHGIMVTPQEAATFRSNERLISELTESDIQIYMMEGVQKWDGKSPLRQEMLKEVEIEDLLPREEIEVNMTAIGQMLYGKRILITGAAGSIGSEMVRQIASFAPSEMILIDQAETPMHDIRLLMARSFADVPSQTIVTSITNQRRMEQIFAEHRPEYVFHAAAYKHVPMMEDNPSEAVQNNIEGTKVIADLAVKYGTRKFVMISTDKAVNPTNVMGCSKRICEMYCQSLNNAQTTCQFVTTRFGNVLGSNGSVIPIFREQIRRGGPVTVTHPDIIRFFMLIPEACKLVLEAGTFGKGGEIFVFDMGKPVKIADLAKRMIALSGATDVEIQYTGLRDGEKLFEEVLSTAEVTKPTPHAKIFVAQVREYPFADVSRQVDELYQLSFTASDMDIVRKMKEMVPEFKSQHSKYQALD